VQVRFEEAFERFRENYRGLLERCLHHRRAFLIAFFAACLGSLVLIVPWLGEDFFPTIDSGSFNLHLRAPTGTRIEETARLCDLVEQSIESNCPQARSPMSLTISGSPTAYQYVLQQHGNRGPRDADILVTFAVNRHKTAQYVHDLRISLAKQFPGVTFSFLPPTWSPKFLISGCPLLSTFK